MDMKLLVETTLGPPERSSGNWSWWHCPFHEDKDPSFGVDDDHAYCFSCHRWLGSIRFLMDVAGWARTDSLAYNGVFSQSSRRQVFDLPPLPPTREWRAVFHPLVTMAEEVLASPVGTPGRQELQRRHIRKETWERYHVGYRPVWQQINDTWFAGGLVFPCFVDGELWSVNVRTFSGRSKYLRPAGGSPVVLFGIDQLEDRPTLVLAEGEFDALIATQECGDEADALGLRGAANKLGDWAVHLMMYEQIIIALDGDEPGIETARMLQAENPLWANRQPPFSANDLCDMAIAGYGLYHFLLKGEQICL